MIDNYQMDFLEKDQSLEEIQEEHDEPSNFITNYLKVKLARTETKMRTTHYFEIIG